MFKVLITTIMTFFLVVASAVAGQSMQTGGHTSQPRGHYDFCKFWSDDCGPNNGSTTAHKLTKQSWGEILTVNSDVNTQIIPRTDAFMWGKDRDEVWSYPSKYGDCEDYVLQKRLLLENSGFSRGNLLITVLRKSDGEGHAVLTVRTDKGDFILDNLTSEVKLWNDTVPEYSYLKRQSSLNAGKWVDIVHSSPSQPKQKGKPGALVSAMGLTNKELEKLGF